MRHQRQNVMKELCHMSIIEPADSHMQLSVFLTIQKTGNPSSRVSGGEGKWAAVAAKTSRRAESTARTIHVFRRWLLMTTSKPRRHVSGAGPVAVVT